jgi:nicotinamide riboside transporter PnuC
MSRALVGFLMIAGFLAWAWRRERRREEQQVHNARPPHDFLKLLAEAIVFVVLLALIIGFSQKYDTIYLYDVNVPGAVLCLLLVYLIFSLGIRSARPPEGARTAGVWKESALLLGSVLAFCTFAFTEFAVLDHYRVRHPILVAWATLMFLIVCWRLLRRRHSGNGQRHIPPSV